MSSDTHPQALQSLHLGELAQAMALFVRDAEENPQALQPLLGLVRVCLATANPEGAREVLKRILERDPQQPEAQAFLARIDAEGDPSALDRLRALARAPHAGFFVQLSLAIAAHDTAALARARALAERNPDAWIELGHLALSQRDPREAARCFTRAAEADPTDFVPLQLAARALVLDRSLAPAGEALVRAIRLAPREVTLHGELFKVCMLAGDTASAIQAARRIRLIEPDNARALYLEGLAALLGGISGDAKTLFEAALARDPSQWEAAHALSKLVAIHDRARAVSLLESVVAKHPGEPGPANDLALLYLEKPLGSLKAERVLRAVLARLPDDAATHFNLALALAQRDPIAARASARKASESSDPQLREQAVRLSVELGR